MRISRSALHSMAAIVALLGWSVAACGRSTPTAVAPTSTTPAATSAASTNPATTATATTIPTTSPTTSPTTTVAPALETVAYVVRDGFVAPVARTGVAGDDALTATLRATVAGPLATETGLTTAIPAGTTFHGVTRQGTTAVVDLGPAFTTGGGSMSMFLRLAQLTFAATHGAEVTSIRIAIDGTLLTELGGEGIDVSVPLTRAGFADQTPAILLESPLPGGHVVDPIIITGTANTYEATFLAEIRNAGGTLLTSIPVMATSGSGTRGTFRAEVPLNGATGAVTLSVYESSAEDGTPVNRVDIPLTVS